MVRSEPGMGNGIASQLNWLISTTRQCGTRQKATAMGFSARGV
jgi:hypothetical protein